MQSKKEPMVGVFWLFRRRILTNCTLVSQAEPYGVCLTHPRGHLDVWTEMQATGEVPRDVEYEEPPRGRVLFDKRHDRFLVLADACILRRSYLVRQILARLRLPQEKTELNRDAHYRCAKCLARTMDLGL